MSTTSKILVVASEASDRDAITPLLDAEQFEVIETDNPVDAMSFIDTPVDLVISGFRLPHFDGIEFLRRWQEQLRTTPFILVADAEDAASAVEAMKQGAADYITKPVIGDELIVRIVHCLDTKRTEERLHELESQLDNGSDQAHPAGIDIPAGTSLEDLERVAVEKALQQHHGNRTHAAKTLGISVRTLQRKLKAWRMPVIALRNHSSVHDFSMPYAH